MTPATPPSAPARPSVFIVDDTVTNIQVLISLLEGDCEMRFATSGPDALEMLRTGPLPDLVLLDVMMPDMDGYEVIAALKANPLTRSVPVLFVTAKSDPESESRAFAAGAVDFIHKPFNHDVVRARVRLHLQLQATHAELSRHRDHLEELVEARTRELAAARDAAESANRAKSAFLANISHELRTPLNHILGFATLLEMYISDPQGQDFLKNMVTSGNHLLELVKNVLDLTRSEASEIELADIDFELIPWLQHLTNQQRGTADQKGLVLRLEHDATLPQRLRGDPLRLGQVVGAFLDNAVKFSSRGEVRLCTQLLAQHPRAVTLRIEVKDHGNGVPPEGQQQLFQLFQQGDNSLTRAHGGLGLGLALSQRLAALMNGQIDWHSEPGEGCTFALTLRMPLALNDGAAIAGSDGGRNAAKETAVYLGRLLRDGDSHALTLWKQSRLLLAPTLGERTGPIDQAISTFNFDAAWQLLKAVVPPASPSA